MQTFEGWGASLAWWANVVGQYPDAIRQDYVEKIFDPVKGLGLNIVRYNIGGGENPRYSYLQYHKAVPGYEPSPGRWDWTADAGQRWVLEAAIAKGVDCVDAASYSPPYWMTVSGSVTGSVDGADNLDAKYDDAFADYLAEVVKHFRDEWGVNFRTVAPFNEPDGNWWKMGETQEGCCISTPHQQAIIKHMRRALSSRGLTTPISGPETNWIDNAASMFRDYDDESKSDLSQIHAHSYGGTRRTEMANLANEYGKRVWMSEYGDEDVTGLVTSRHILDDVKKLRASAWIYWQAVDTWKGWGFLLTQLEKTPVDYTVNMKYYVIGNYSKFIRRGYRIINIDDENSLAAWDRKTHTLAIVTTNDTDTDTHVDFDLTRFSQCGNTALAYRTSANEHLAQLAPIAVTNKRFTTVCPAKSVTTFVVHGVDYHGPQGFEPTAYYRVVNGAAGLDLGVDGGSTAGQGAKAVLDGAESSASNQWAIVPTGGKGFFLVNRASGLILDVSESSKSPGGIVHIWGENDGLNQRWTLEKTNDGDYRIVSQVSDLLLSASGPSASLGSHVTQETESKSGTDGRSSTAAYQIWRIEKVASHR